jgi:hypothetical protein
LTCSDGEASPHMRMCPHMCAAYAGGGQILGREAGAVFLSAGHACIALASIAALVPPQQALAWQSSRVILAAIARSPTSVHADRVQVDHMRPAPHAGCCTACTTVVHASCTSFGERVPSVPLQPALRVRAWSWRPCNAAGPPSRPSWTWIPAGICWWGSAGGRHDDTVCAACACAAAC